MTRAPFIRKFSRCLFACFCATAATLAPCSSRAAIVFFDVPDITISNSPAQSVIFADINLTNGTYTTGAPSGLWMEFAFSGNGAGLWIAMGNSISFATDNGGPALFLNYGDSVYPPSVLSWANGTDSGGAWSSGGAGYLGLIRGFGQIADLNFGWAAINYNSAGVNSTLTISGFAFESNLGQSIFAGEGGPPPGPSSVPEPGTW
ncbi:MAG: hypothetical protein ACKOB0_14210, partial [Chthoniobacterales bacterium]